MGKVTFQNKGLIDLDLIQTFGASVKTNDNPIGYFGTGLKYAIAILLRHNCKIQLLRDSETYTFTLKSKTIRGKELQFVMMNGVQLGFTSELGRNWEPWMAYRELYSNCMDEPEAIVTVGKKLPQHKPNTTSISVTWPIVGQARYCPEDIFLQSDALHTSPGCDIHPYYKGYVYYKGIRVGQDVDMQYAYNIHRNIGLTEDRTISDWWQIRAAIESAIFSCPNATILRKCITKAKPGLKPYEFRNSYPHHPYPSETFLRTTLECVKRAKALTSKTAIAVCKQHLAELQPTNVQLNDIQLQQYDKAKRVLHKMSINVEDYPISFVTELGDGVLGLAETDPNHILISIKCFDLGTKFLTTTLYEEYVHLRYGLDDESRSMQNFLFDKLFSYVEAYILKEPI